VWFTGGAWIAVVLVLTWPRAAGDVVVPGTWYGYAFLILGMGLAMVAATLAWLRSAVQVPASASAIAPERR
jgi:hypothetical protein